MHFLNVGTSLSLQKEYRYLNEPSFNETAIEHLSRQSASFISSSVHGTSTTSTS